jgi:hypothetical protein
VAVVEAVVGLAVTEETISTVVEADHHLDVMREAIGTGVEIGAEATGTETAVTAGAVHAHADPLLVLVYQSVPCFESIQLVSKTC